MRIVTLDADRGSILGWIINQVDDDKGLCDDDKSLLEHDKKADRVMVRELRVC